MVRASLVVAAALALAGCNEQELAAEKDRINLMLPDGCVFADLGEYGSVDQVVAVFCDDRSSVSATSVDIERHGKTTSRDISTVVQVH